MGLSLCLVATFWRASLEESIPRKSGCKQVLHRPMPACRADRMASYGRRVDVCLRRAGRAGGLRPVRTLKYYFVCCVLDQGLTRPCVHKRHSKASCNLLLHATMCRAVLEATIFFSRLRSILHGISKHSAEPKLQRQPSTCVRCSERARLESSRQPHKASDVGKEPLVDAVVQIDKLQPNPVQYWFLQGQARAYHSQV